MGQSARVSRSLCARCRASKPRSGASPCLCGAVAGSSPLDLSAAWCFYLTLDSEGDTTVSPCVSVAGLRTDAVYCHSPIAIYRPDDVGRARVRDPGTGAPLWQFVPCSKCPACIANRKNDWTGRLNAEGMCAAATYFVTLTYRDEPEDFQYRDVQLMLKRLRKAAAERNFSVRFFCVGERGNKKGRIHWHLLLFLDRPINFLIPKPGELWRFWPHGWTQLKRVEKSDMLRSIRYVSKYAIKSMGQDDKSCRMRCSMKPLIGSAFLDAYAVDLANAGLPAKGWYNLPGTVYTAGRKAGAPIRFRLTHAAARRFARIYMETWDTRYPGRLYPHTSWLVRWSGCLFGIGPGPERFDVKFCEFRYYPKGETLREQAQERQSPPEEGDAGEDNLIEPERPRAEKRRAFFERLASGAVSAIHDFFGDCPEVEREAHRIYDECEAFLSDQREGFCPSWSFRDFGSPQFDYKQIAYADPAEGGRREVDPFEGHEDIRTIVERVYHPGAFFLRACDDERRRQARANINAAIAAE
nr:MAG: replication initiator protein [Microvirus sp.]